MDEGSMPKGPGIFPRDRWLIQRENLEPNSAAPERRLELRIAVLYVLAIPHNVLAVCLP